MNQSGFNKPNILFIMCDQFRFDCIHALGNQEVLTPNLDRLVKRGITFSNGYSTCPVCVPARYTIRTGCEPLHTGCFQNEAPKGALGQADTVKGRCGEYLATEMRKLGYYTFGIGKFHTFPEFKEDCGYDLQLSTEEMWNSKKEKEQDAYASFIANEHPEYAFIEQLHGERTNMYYMPQTSAMPAHLTVESYVADRAVEQIRQGGKKPYFGFVSFIGPHPPCAPPLPYNRMYNPDHLANPQKGDLDVDFMDEQIPWMNYLIWADGLNDFMARNIRSRYYGEITYIDSCIGRILDAVEEREDKDQTLICFFADHGDHLGDHHAWQKESYFEQSCHVPFLLSWPEKYEGGRREEQLVCLTDLFGIATGAAGGMQVRDGHPILSVLDGEEKEREYLFACYGRPGTPQFKTMIREGRWKYIFLANGNREQLFDLETNPQETVLQNDREETVLARMREINRACLNREVLDAALLEGEPRTFPYKERERFRIRQFDESSGVKDFML